MRIMQLSAQNKLRSGGTIQMVRLANELHRLGHEVSVVCGIGPDCSRENRERFLDQGIDFMIDDLRKPILAIRTMRTVAHLRKFISEHKIEIIHAHKGRATDYAILATMGTRIPVIANRGVTNALDFFNSRKYHYPRVRRIIAVSKAVKDVMVKTGGINPDKITVVYGSIDPNVFYPDLKSNVREQFGISTETFVWGFVGNTGPRKGFEYMMEGFLEYRKDYTDDKLMLVGVDENNPELKPYKDRMGSSVVIAGFRQNTQDYYAAFNSFVFTGVAEEGLTGTVREAAAMRLPIISTDVAGNREMIFDGETGLLIPMRDPKAIVASMKRIRENPSESARMAQNAWQFVQNNMTSAIRTNKLLEIYEDAIRSMK